jgi:hypothetical protein
LTGFPFPCADKFPRKNGKLFASGHIQTGLCPKITPTRTQPAVMLSARQSTADNNRPPSTHNQQLKTNNHAFTVHFCLRAAERLSRWKSEMAQLARCGGILACSRGICRNSAARLVFPAIRCGTNGTGWRRFPIFSHRRLAAILPSVPIRYAK